MYVALQSSSTLTSCTPCHMACNATSVATRQTHADATFSLLSGRAVTPHSLAHQVKAAGLATAAPLKLHRQHQHSGIIDTTGLCIQ
jgi:hypothetical protein